MSPGASRSPSAAIASSVAAPCGSITQTARGAASAATTPARSAAPRRAIGRHGGDGGRVAVPHHAAMAGAHQATRDVGAHPAEADDADLHGGQPFSAARTRPMNPSIAAGSVQRSTATMPEDGSTQVRLPPAPEAKKASRAAEGKRVPSVFSHHRKP